MWEQLVGARSEPVTNWVERGAVRKFAAAIGDFNPLYFDEEAAARSHYGGLIAPPTFPVTFDYGSIPDLVLPASGLIHGEQRFRYVRPLLIGETARCFVQLQRVYEKRGSHGLLTFLELKRATEDQHGASICAMEAVVIVTETVRQGLGL